MHQKYFLSIASLICLFILSHQQLHAQEEEGEIIIISERVGEEIDRDERARFNLFQEIDGFQSAVYIKLPDNRYFLKITYLDEKTGKQKISHLQQSETSIKNRRKYLDHFEENQASTIDAELTPSWQAPDNIKVTKSGPPQKVVQSGSRRWTRAFCTSWRIIQQKEE
ncbi:hypothetical protein JXJ21_14910 [candidate division KSB1 bacterium]|nr:hypothetical protein [candidate division KSB1 bacterium]